MPSRNDRQQNRPVTYSHYTKSKRIQTQTPSDKVRKPSVEENTGDSSKRKSTRHSGFNSYFANHLWALISTLGSLYRTPVSTLMTTAVIGIALALPAGLFIILQNVQHLSTSWDNGAQISLFLKQEVNTRQANALVADLKSHTQIKNVEYISAEQALEEFRLKSGFENALAMLEENPLPSVLVVSLLNQYPDQQEVEVLMQYLQEQQGVDMAQLDMQWLQRLNGIIDIGKRGSLIVALMLAIAILVIVGNTIRLTIQNRRQEIEVTKLIGGTDAFIQRPFLYAGIWYGFIGGLLAWLLVFGSLQILDGPVNKLSSLYNSQFELIGLGAGESIILLMIGLLLGWLGSWFSVRRHLREIEPQ